MIHSVTSMMRTLCVLAVVGSIVGAGVAGATASQQTAAPESTEQGTMQLSDGEGTVGETVTVELTLTGEAISSYQAVVQYNPDIVSLESVSGGEIGDSIPKTVDEEAGIVQFGQAGQSAAGSQLVGAELTFTLEQSGETQLTLVDEKSTLYSIEDPGEEDPTVLPATVSDGRISVTEAGGSSSGGVAAPPVGGQSQSGGGESAEQSATESPEESSETTDASQEDSEQQSADEQQTDEESTDEPEDDSADSATDPSTDDEASGEQESGGMPGFGIGAAVVILLGVALIAGRRR